jgi:hypothetical protein
MKLPEKAMSTRVAPAFREMVHAIACIPPASNDPAHETQA